MVDFPINKEYLGWITAGIALLLLILRDLITENLKKFFQLLFDAIYKRVSGNRLFLGTALKRYSQALFEQYREIRVIFRPNRPLILKDVYVPLKMTDTFGTSKIDSNDAVIQYPHLMIIGAPGSGKSTLLKHLMLSFFSGRISSLPNRPIPILLELNRLNNPNKNLFNELVEVLRRNDFPNGENFVTLGLDQGSIVILLDGLDEINSKERNRVVLEVRDFSQKYPKCRLIITCRTAVYNGEFKDIVDQTFEIAEFDDRQIRQFLGSWEKEMPRDKSINQLMETLHDRPRIMELARNPLMLTIIAYLYCDTPHELPHSRSEFYKISTDVLLRLWHQEDIKNEFTSPAKQTVLKHLALFNQIRPQQGNRRSIKYETIMEEIKNVLPSINLKNEDAEPLLKEIVERSGLLISIDGGVEYQFAHLTLQEYFAALELGDEQKKLIEYYKADPDSWREPIKLWCGLGNDSTGLIQTIFGRDPVMAFECLADVIKVEIGLANKIIIEFENRMLRNEAPESVQKAFGAVASNIKSLRGEEVFKFLINTLQNEKINPSIRKAAAMSLSATNLPQAADVLARYFLLKVEGCRDALIRMGDLAVPALEKECKGENSVECILALWKIGIPSAAKAIVPNLWDTGEEIALTAAWSLGNLIQSKDIEEALRNHKLTTQHFQETLDWVWEPFKEPGESSLPRICGRIAYILNNSKSIPDNLFEYTLDPRFSIPLSFIGLTDEAHHAIQKIEGKPMMGLINIQKEGEKEWKKTVNEAITIIENRDDSPEYLKSMKSGLRFEFTRRLLSNKKKPTQIDWSNVLHSEDYQFKKSLYFYTIVFITLILSGISLYQMILNIYLSPILLSYWNVFLNFLIFNILYCWFVFFSPEEEPFGFSRDPVGLFALILADFIVPWAYYEQIRDNNFDIAQNRKRILQGLFFLPWAPTIGYFTTTSLLNFVSMSTVIIFWIIIIGFCGSLAFFGDKKEERSKNPIRGILNDIPYDE